MKKKSSLKVKPVEAVLNNDPFGKVFVSKDNTLAAMAELPESAKPIPKSFASETAFAELIFGNRAVLFGEKTIGLKLTVPKHVPFQNTTLLFDFTDPDKPRYYFLLVILSTGKDFYRDFSPFMANAFSIIRDVINLSKMVVLLGEHIRSNKAFLKELNRYFPGKRIEDVIAHTLLETPRCLLVTENTPKELSTVQKAYAETWGALLDVMYVRKYLVGKSTIISLHPTLSELRMKQTPVQKAEPKVKVKHTEADHFAKGAPHVKTIYEKLKAEALKIDRKLLFNADGAHYISMKKMGGKNLAFFHFRKGGMYLVVKLAEKIVRKTVKKAEIKSLPESVQKFWNGESTGLVISDQAQLTEVGTVLKQLIR